MNQHRAIFLDKDGTLIEDVPFNVDPSRIEFTSGAVEGLRMLRDHGYRFYVVSNQSGVALGRFSQEALVAVSHRLHEMFSDAGLMLDDFVWCPHDPLGSISEFAKPCRCRKPSDGMIRDLSTRDGIDLQQSWMIGDILHDVEAGHRAGCRTIMIDNGHETEWLPGRGRMPNHFATNLLTAARMITFCENSPQGR